MRIEDNEDDESQIHSPQKNSRPISEIDERTSHKKKNRQVEQILRENIMLRNLNAEMRSEIEQRLDVAYQERDSLLVTIE